MIPLTNDLKTLFKKQGVESFICVKLASLTAKLNGIDTDLLDGFNTTTYHSDVTIEGVIYSADSSLGPRLLSVEPPKFTSTVDRDLYTLTFSDSNLYFKSIFSHGLNSRNISIRLCFVDHDGSVSPESFIMYEGLTESGGYTLDTSESGTIVVTITCSNLMASLDSTRPYYTSKNFVKNIDPTDTSYDQIYEGSGKIILKWGKA